MNAQHLSLFLCTVLSLGYYWVVSPPGFRVTALDVGQGTSVLVTASSGELFLFDGGPDESANYQLGQLLAPWQRTLSVVVVTHLHTDHITGLIDILRQYKVGEVWLPPSTHTTEQYRALLNEIDDQKIPHAIHYALEGCNQTCLVPRIIGSGTLTILHPPKPPKEQPPPDQHDANLVTHIQDGAHSALLTGDLNFPHLLAIQALCKEQLCANAEVLLAPHHGSKTGLTPAFLALFSPKVVLISVGEHNFYHHPHPSILALLSEKQIPYYRTDQSGSITVFFAPELRVSAQHLYAATHAADQPP